MRPDVFQERPSSRVQSGRSRRRDVPSTRPAGRRRLLAVEQLEGRTLPTTVTPFAPRFETDTNGDIAIVANTLMTVSPTNSNAANIQAGVNNPSGVDNNNLDMVYVNDGSNPTTTFDSSSAQLNLPQGATVLFAGLYWGGDLDTSSPSANELARTQVKFETPSSGGYSNITGTLIGENTAGSSNPGGYHAFADVTGLVSAAGNGTYTVANVQATQGVTSSGRYAGWSLVVAYNDPNSPPRNLTVFDGYSQVDVKLPPTATTIPISGFETPPLGSGPVNAQVGIVAYEGDLGITGDTASLDNVLLTDATHPKDNFFKSTISNLGVNVTSKTPNYINQLGYDSSIIQANGIIPNGATSADIELTTSGDSYFPGVVTTAIDLYAPNIKSTKSVVDMSGGSVVRPGDILDYTINVSNTGGNSAKDVILSDPIPNFTQFVPGSLQVTAGANTGTKTDAAGDDQAEYDAAGNQVIFRLGAGANARSGGVLPIGGSSTVSFEVQVDPGTPGQTVVTNQATIDYTGVATGIPLSTLSNPADVTVVKANTSTATVIKDATTNGTPTGALGESVYDTATVTGTAGFTPTGTVTYNFYNTATPAYGTTAPVTTQTVTLTATGAVPNSADTAALAAGSYSYIAVYSGDSNYNGSRSDVEPLTIVKANTSTATVIKDATTNGTPTGALGESVYDTATVTGTAGFTPTGTVTYNFYNTATPAYGTTAPVTTQTVTLTATGAVPNSADTAALAAGSYSYIAVYSGDSNYNGSRSDVEPLTIAKANTSTATVIKDATTNGTPTGALGESVYDTATVTGTAGFTPTGTVTYNFYNTATPAYGTTAPVTTQTVTLTATGAVPNSADTAALAAGSYSYIAVYSGDSNYNGSRSDVEPLTIAKANTSTATVIKDATTNGTPTGALGESVYDTATVTGTAGFTPTGTVTYNFYNTATPAYGTTAPVTTQTVTLTATGAVPNSADTAALAAGSYSYIAVYSGDSNYNGSRSDVEPLTIAKANTSTATVIKDATTNGTPTGALGESVYDTATVTGTAGFTPTGTVTYNFYNTATPAYGTTAPVTTQTVTLTATGAVPNSADTAALAAGSYSYIAVYSGDSNYNGSRSDVEPLTIAKANTSTATVIKDATTNGTPTGALGESVYDTATVTGTAGFTPTGTVTYNFYNTATPVYGMTTPVTTQMVTLTATGAVPNSSATAALAAGSYSYIAVYSGDSNYNGSTSPVEPLPIAKADTSTATVIKDATTNGTPTGALGESVYDTATVIGTAGFTPTGTVTYNFYNTATPVYGMTTPVTTQMVTLTATGAVPNSSATAALAAGSYSYIAVYSGDSNYNSKVGLVEPLTAIPGPVNPDGPRIISVLRYGYHMQPTTLVLEFDQPLDPVPATDVHNYHITGPAGRSIAIASAQYDPSTDMVALHPTKRINLHYTYTLTVSGTGPNGLTDTDGRLLDGNDDGKPGGNFKTTITRRNLVLGSPPTRSITSRIPAFHKGRPIPPKYPLHKGRSW